MKFLVKIKSLAYPDFVRVISLFKWINLKTIRKTYKIVKYISVYTFKAPLHRIQPKKLFTHASKDWQCLAIPHFDRL